MDVGDWLRGLGLDAYAPAFRANDVDMAVLPDLTDADFNLLGVHSVGHRRKLAAAILHLRRLAPAPTGEAAERRQMTIMFCDLVGSTALAARLDPEDWRAVVVHYHASVAEQVRRFDGFVASYMGDGVLIYFGYPAAHEDDAERAVRAGLDVLAAVARMPASVGRLQARIGVATGRVVVGEALGDGAAQEQVAVGVTPNLAARLQDIAAPGTMVIAASTRRLLGRMFELRDLGERTIKGLAHPVAAWVVERALAPESRFEALRRSGMAAMVGRTAERKILVERRALAWNGAGQVVVLSGEPGIGKSRLATWLCDDSTTRRHRRYRFQCSQYHRDSPLYPFITQLRHVAGLQPSDDAQTRLDRLGALVATAGAEPLRLVPLLAALLEAPGADDDLPPATRRARTLAAFLTLLAAIAQRHPVLVLFEDAHWADATSLELLDQIVSAIATLPVVLLVTCRPEFPLRWVGQPHMTALLLDRLDQPSIRTIVTHAARSSDLPTEAVRQIVAKAEGIPLFAEELARTMLDQSGLPGGTGQRRPASPGEDGGGAFAVPDTLHDLLMARLDSMASAKEVAQIGAVIGREFPRDLLRGIYDQSEVVLDAALARLQDAALVFSRGEASHTVYSFRHALVQDAAYASLLKTRRNALHQHIAELLSRQADQPGAEPEIVAQHYARAGLLEAAVVWWSHASTRALLRSAYPEAMSHFRNALTLIEELGEHRIERKLLLKLHIDYGQALIAARGYNAPETYATFLRAHELATLIEDPAERFAAFYGLWSRHFVRGDLASMSEVATAFLQDVGALPDSPAEGVANRVAGVTCWYRGDFIAGRRYLQRAVALYDPVRDRPLAFQFGQDVGLAAMTYLALDLWPLGEVTLAGETLEAAHRLGVDSAQASSIAYLHFYTALFHSLRLMPEAAAPSLEALDAVTHAHGLTFWQQAGIALHGWVTCCRGDQARGMAMIREGLAIYVAQGFGSIIPVVVVLQAEIARDANEIKFALEAVARCLKQTAPAGEHWLQAEMLRARGGLLLRQAVPDAAAAAAAFRGALTIADRQGTRTFGLRAATDLARLVGFEESARLRALLDRFEPGASLPEIDEAWTLLAALERRRPTLKAVCGH